MKNITLILFVLLAFSSCKKRDVFYEDKMWDKLSKGNGIWLLEKREVFVIKSDGSTELTFIEEPDQTKYYFYTKIIQLFGISVENDYARSGNSSGLRSRFQRRKRDADARHEGQFKRGDPVRRNPRLHHEFVG